MSPMQFQKELRAIADRYLAAVATFHREMSAVFAAADASAENEPELFGAITQGESARIDRIMREQENHVVKYDRGSK